jgi:hypothetical protein
MAVSAKVLRVWLSVMKDLDSTVGTAVICNGSVIKSHIGASKGTMLGSSSSHAHAPQAK